MSGGDRAVFVRATGRVQGVNFRNFVRGEAVRLGLVGWVANRDDGSVEAAFYGSGEALAKVVELCRRGPPHAHVDNLELRSTDRGDVDEPPPGAYRF